MKQTRFGPQPAKALLEETGRSLGRLASEVGVTHSQLGNAINGRCPPAPEVRERLPSFLGRALEELFTSESLATERHANRARRPDDDDWWKTTERPRRYASGVRVGRLVL